MEANWTIWRSERTGRWIAMSDSGFIVTSDTEEGLTAKCMHAPHPNMPEWLWRKIKARKKRAA